MTWERNPDAPYPTEMLNGPDWMANASELEDGTAVASVSLVVAGDLAAAKTRAEAILATLGAARASQPSPDLATLREWLAHKPDCRKVGGGPMGAQPCSCGLDALLATPAASSEAAAPAGVVPSLNKTEGSDDNDECPDCGVELGGSETVCAECRHEPGCARFHDGPCWR